MNILLDIFTYHDLQHCCVTVAQWGCAQLLLHNKQILRSSCVKKEKKDREYLQREVFCTADTTSWHATQFQRETKEKRGVINGIRSSQSSSAKSVDIQFIGQVGLVQGMKNIVVHQLNLVYHPLELQNKEKNKKKRNTHMAGGQKKRQKEKGSQD